MKNATDRSTTRRRPGRHVDGYTMIELVVSIAVMTLLLAGMTSVILVASHAIPDGKSPVDRTMNATFIVQDIEEDIRFATMFVTRDPNSVEFVVPDRNGDATPETIIYSWSGTAGDPLKRQFNAGTAVNVLDNIYQFDLTYDIDTVVAKESVDPSESAETVLFSYDSVSNLSRGNVEHDKWWGQYFIPTLPADAVSWKVTRVQIMAEQHSDPIDTTIELRLPNADLTPGDAIIDTATLSYASLTASPAWVERPFANASGLRPDTGLCLTILNYSANGNSCKIQYQNNNVVLPGAALSYDKPTWDTVVTDEALLFYVYGTVTTQAEPLEVSTYHLAGVHIDLRIGEGVHPPVSTRVGVINRPVVATP